MSGISDLFHRKNREGVKKMARKIIDTIEVKVSRSGTSFMKAVTLNGDRSIAAALKAAGISQKEAENVLVNNEEIDNLKGFTLENNDKIVLVKDVAGGGFTWQ